MSRRFTDTDDDGMRSRYPCQFAVDHPRIDERLEQLEDRADKQDAIVQDLRDLLQSVQLAFVEFKASIRTGIAVGIVAGSVISAIVGWLFQIFGKAGTP